MVHGGCPVSCRAARTAHPGTAAQSSGAFGDGRPEKREPAFGAAGNAEQWQAVLDLYKMDDPLE